MAEQQGKTPQKQGGDRGQSESVDSTAQARLEVGRFLRRAREAQRLTQNAVSEMTRSGPWPISRAGISAIERGENFPGLGAMLALQRVLRVDLDALIDRARISTSGESPPNAQTELTDAALEKRASNLFWDGHYRAALAIYDQLIGRLNDRDDASSARCAKRRAALEIRRATCLKRMGATGAAIAATERAISNAPDDSVVQAEGYVLLATLRIDRGHLPLARDAVRRAIQLGEQAGPKFAGWARIVAGRVEFACGRYDEARRMFLRAAELAEAASDVAHQTHIEGNIGSCYRAEARHDDAAHWFTKAIRLATEQRQPILEAGWRIEFGGLELDRGRTGEASEQARAAMRIARARKHVGLTFRADWLQHRIARQIDPEDGDVTRLERLRKLYGRLDAETAMSDAAEFRRDVLDRGLSDG